MRAMACWAVAWLVTAACMVSCQDARASAIPVTLPSNVAAVAGGGYMTTGSAAWNGGRAAVNLTTQVAGRAVTIPAAMRMAANAPRIAMAAVRVTPGLATLSVLSMLISYGIQKCVQADGWCVQQPSPSAGESGFNGWRWMGAFGKVYSSPEAACRSFAGGSISFNSLSAVDATTYNCNLLNANNGAIAWGAAQVTQALSCVPGSVVSGSKCVLSADAQQPATDADWAKVNPQSLPDQVASDLAGEKVGIPVELDVNPSPITVPMSEPYKDPVTGQRYRDVAQITPNPNKPTEADLQTAKQPVDEKGNPAPDPDNPGKSKPPEENKDQCKGHESRLGCMEQGEVPEGPDLLKKEVQVSIAPVGGFGPDNGSCPADKHTLVLGKPVAVSWGPTCTFAQGLRPVVLAVAWIAAICIALGVRLGGGES